MSESMLSLAVSLSVVALFIIKCMIFVLSIGLIFYHEKIVKSISIYCKIATEKVSKKEENYFGSENFTCPSKHKVGLSYKVFQ